MGKKVNPKGYRLGTIFTWDSKWFARKNDYKRVLSLDIKIKDFLRKELKNSSISKIGIEKTANSLVVNIYTAKPGVLIGKGGAGIEELKKKIKHNFFASEKVNLEVNILEVSKPALNSELVLQSIAAEIEKRVPFRKVMKQAIGKVERAGGRGVKVAVSGRLNGAEIARREVLSSGKIPLQTLRANIDYSQGVASTIYGVIGIKVWIYKGDVFAGDISHQQEHTDNNNRGEGRKNERERVVRPRRNAKSE
jgi:small subunit ribosomal protein S3